MEHLRMLSIIWLFHFCFFNPSFAWLDAGCMTRYWHRRNAGLLHRVYSLEASGAPNNNVEVYSTIGCKYCKLAKLTLAGEGIKYVNIDINVDDIISLNIQQQERYLYTKSKTVPQIYIGDELLGGCDNLLIDIKRGDFNNRLKRNNITVYSGNDSLSTTDVTTPDKHRYTHDPLKALNLQHVNDDVNNITTSLDAISLSSLLQSQALQLLDKYSVLFNNGSSIYVNYDSMRNSDELKQYIQTTSSLSTISLSRLTSLSNSGKLAFFVNLYNALIIHAYCIIGAPADTPGDRSKFFSGKSGAYYDISGYNFSPDDIEHGILRANSPHPSNINDTSYYTLSDPRSHLSVAFLDPRIHFVLSCGASSCPPIKILTEENIDEALELASESYLSNEVIYDASKHSFRLPKLLLWYGKDFIRRSLNDDEANFILLKQIYQLMNKELELNEILRDNKNISIAFNDYNWNPNGLLKD